LFSPSIKKCVPYLALLFLVFAERMSAQSAGTINGFVRDAENGESLPYANVFLKDTSLGAVTNERGYYVIYKIPAGTYTLIFSVLGYERFEKTVKVEERKTLTENASLKMSPIEMAAVVKTAERERQEREIVTSTTTLQARQVINMPGLAEPDLFRTLQMLPGVVSRSDFSSQLYVRGGSPDQNLVLLDGVTVYNPFHLGGLFSTFNVDAIKEVEFMSGGFPAEYGGRLSSVLNITNREGNSKKWDGNGNISLLSAKTLLEGPVPGGSLLITARRTYFDQLFKGTDYEFPYYFYDFQGKVNLDLSQAHRLTFTGFYGDDVLDFTFEENESEDFNVDLNWVWGNRTSSINWRWIIHPRLFSEVLLTRSRFRNDLNLDITDGTNAALDIHNGITDWSAKGDFTYFGIRNHSVQFGAVRSWLSFKYQFAINNMDLFNYHSKPEMTSFYGQDQWQVSKRLSIKTGARLDYYNLGQRWRFSPRLAVKYQLFSNISAKASWGIYHQYMTTAVSDEQNFNFIDLWFPLTSKYEPQSATHYVSGIEWWLPHELILTCEIYYKKMTNLFDLNEKGDFADENDDFFVGDGYAQGAELLIKRTIGRLTGWLGYSYSLTKRDINHIVYYPKQDRRHSLNAVISYDLGRGWTLGTLFAYGSGMPYTPVPGKYAHYEWDFHNNELTNEIYNRKGAKNSARYPAYHRMDVSIQKQWELFGLHNKPYLQIVNVYNRQNVFFYFWDHDSNPSKLAVVKMFPFLPTIGVEFDF
jgi:hypothetical protein